MKTNRRRLLSVVLTACMLLSLIPLGIRAQEPDATEQTVDFSSAADGEKFDLYHSSNGGFTVSNGMLTPTGAAGEFKALYKTQAESIQSVSVELHPLGTNGPIYGGLYIGASNANHAQDQINALYIGVESHFSGWSDAPNRVDVVVGQFPVWKEHTRKVAETGAGNALFTGGVKQPLTLRADIDGNRVTVTLSLTNNPAKYVTTSFVADRDLSTGAVGIRSHHNNARYDNFTVKGIMPEGSEPTEPTEPEIVPPTDLVDFESQDSGEKFDFYHSSNGGLAVQDGKLVPTGEAGQFKAIYKDENACFSQVSVDIYPGQNGINGGLYVDVTDVDHPTDRITGLGILVQADFTGWSDAPNRLDLVLGTFPQWMELGRVISETGMGNNLFSGGVREPINLTVQIEGNRLTATVRLLSNPNKQISASWVYSQGTDLGLGNVGIRSQFSGAAYDNFAVHYTQVEEDKEPDVTEPPVEPPVMPDPTDLVDFENQDSSAKFDFYHSSTGGLQIQEGKLVPMGEDGEFKAIYRDGGSTIQGVCVDIYPGESGQINSGLYIGASTVENGVDRIKGLSVMVESNHSGWDDAVNRIDIVVGRFPIWKELHRYISETGSGNALFAGAKEPLRLYVTMEDNLLTVTLSLISDPTKFVTTTYAFTGATPLSAHNVGIRSAFNDVRFDDFGVYSQPGGGSADPDGVEQEMPSNNASPNTGDASIPATAAMLLLLSLTGLVLILGKKHKMG